MAQRTIVQQTDGKCGWQLVVNGNIVARQDAHDSTGRTRKGFPALVTQKP
ncbi:hypothetical protein ACFYSW_30150 [Rhodococcus aetherivorans]